METSESAMAESQQETPQAKRDSRATADGRPALAVISNSCPPYRLHVLRRIVREIPQIKLFSVFTHEISNSTWAFDPPAEIGPVSFGRGEPAAAPMNPSWAVREWRKGGRIIDWLKAQQVRAVVIGGYNDPGRLRVIRWCHQHDVPCFLQADSNVLDDTQTAGIRARIKKAVVSRVVRWCDALLVCGRLGKEYFFKYGARDEQIFYHPYEPDYSLIRALPADAVERARARFGIRPDRRLMIYSGRLVPVKRVDLLIDAFAAIADRRPEWDLLIIGDGPLRAELQSRLPERLRSRATWTGFMDDQTTVSALYRAGDVLVLPSEYEPWALVINEAAAAGLAIVASNIVGAAAELVRDGVNGHIFASRNLDQLTECLLDVTDASRIDSMKSASARVLEDWRRRADPIDGLKQALQRATVLPR
jgi:glycosyltransferase involved in cell wall biosynthesis